jgi:mono/diheme cytochrome c family protein
MSVWRKLAAMGAAAAGLAGLIDLAQAQDVTPPAGKAVFDANCATCHEAPPEGDRTPPASELRKMSAEAIRAALTTGPMKPIGDSLQPQQLNDVVDYLAAPEGPKPSA